MLQRRLFAEPPQVFTMQLAWQSASASQAHIEAVMLGLRRVRRCQALPGFAVHTLVHAGADATVNPLLCIWFAAMHSLTMDLYVGA